MTHIFIFVFKKMVQDCGYSNFEDDNYEGFKIMRNYRKISKKLTSKISLQLLKLWLILWVYACLIPKAKFVLYLNSGYSTEKNFYRLYIESLSLENV